MQRRETGLLGQIGASGHPGDVATVPWRFRADVQQLLDAHNYSGWWISGWQAEGPAGCSRLHSHLRTIFNDGEGAPSYDAFAPSLEFGAGAVMELDDGCQILQPGYGSLFVVARIRRGDEATLICQNANDQDDTGWMLEVLDGRPCVSRRGGEPILAGHTRVDDARWRLIELRMSPEYWSIDVDGRAGAQKMIGDLELRPEHTFCIGQSDNAGLYEVRVNDPWAVGVVGYWHGTSSPMPAAERAKIAAYAIERWGVPHINPPDGIEPPDGWTPGDPSDPSDPNDPAGPGTSRRTSSYRPAVAIISSLVMLVSALRS